VKDNSTTRRSLMKRLLLASAVIAAAATLAACGGGGDSGNSSGTATPATGTATVSAAEIGDLGDVLVDSTGKALYAADEEAGGEVVCTGACESFWMPLTIDGGAPSGDALTGQLGIAQRPDGSRQVTYDGKRLYSFVEDAPGEVTGDGFSDAFDGQQFTWHVVHVEGAADSTGGGTTRDGGIGY
jgi:predicted lipoprotein with Yx(FWY)xxD motif